jgi:hypothetical protein
MKEGVYDISKKKVSHTKKMTHRIRKRKIHPKKEKVEIQRHIGCK